MKITVLGTGLLGSALAKRLLKKRHAVTVYNRTSSKARALGQEGAVVAKTAVDAVDRSDTIILMLADAAAIENVLGKKLSLAHKTVIQMGTIAPQESRRLQKEIEKKGGHYLEAPVLGSWREAEAGTLQVLVGASAAACKKWRRLFQEVASHVHYAGPVGKAAALKLALNHLIASHMVSFSFSLGLVQKAGVSVEQFMTVLRSSALYAPMFDKKLPNLLKRRYSRPNFSLRHMLKDVGLVKQAAHEAGLNAHVVKAIEDVFRKNKEKRSHLDYSIVFEVLAPRHKGSSL